MPPRGVVDVGQAGAGVGNWYQSLPPITRFMATACFLMSLGQYVGLVNPRMLALVGPWVFKKYQVSQQAMATMHGGWPLHQGSVTASQSVSMLIC